MLLMLEMEFVLALISLLVTIRVLNSSLTGSTKLVLVLGCLEIKCLARLCGDTRMNLTASAS